MVKLIGSVIREQNTTFAVALVKDHVVNSRAEANRMIQVVSQALGCPLVVLLGESSRTVRGNRQDVVNFVSRLNRSQIPWKEYQLKA